MQPWRLRELNYGIVKSAAPYDVAVLPLGATEPHNLHLPYGTDTLQVEIIADRACSLAHAAGTFPGDQIPAIICTVAAQSQEHFVESVGDLVS